MKISLVVNGKRETVDADPAMPLLYALRDDLELTPQRMKEALART